MGMGLCKEESMLTEESMPTLEARLAKLLEPVIEDVIRAERAQMVAERADSDWDCYCSNGRMDPRCNHEPSARKDDDYKLRYDLIPPECLDALAYVYTIGAQKYGDHNWLKGMKWGRVIAAAYRHLAAWRQGRTIDPEDAQHPLASVAWCMFTLMFYEQYKLGEDDRRVGLIDGGE